MAQPPARVTTLPVKVKQMLEHYANLGIGGKRVTTPYFMNPKNRKGRRVSVGKGTPKALEKETIRLAKKYNFDYQKATAEEIRAFMIEHRLGIDCSGLVAWTLHTLLQDKLNKPLWPALQLSGHPLRIFIAKRLRPVENISARVLTDKVNAQTIHDLRQVKPGDIVRSLNGNHVLLITEIGYDVDGTPLYFTYINSTEHSGIKYGVREGLIQITQPAGHILQQEWIDGENGVNWISAAAHDYPEDTRIVRLKALLD